MTRLLAALLLLAAAPAAAATDGRPNGAPIAPLPAAEAERLLLDPATTFVSITADPGSATTIHARTVDGLLECESSGYWDGRGWTRDRRVLTCFLLARPATDR